MQLEQLMYLEMTWQGCKLLCFIVVMAAKMNIVSLKIINEKNNFNMNVE